jgi:hypothetical protein
MEAMDQWLGTLRRAFETNFDQLDEVLADMKKRKSGKKRGTR